MNELEIDAARLEAEAAAAVEGEPAAESSSLAGEGAGAIEAETTEPTMEQLEAAAAKFEFGAMVLVSRSFDALAPAWEVTEQERGALAHALALTAAAWFPDAAIPARYMVLLMLGGTAFSIVEARRDPKTGQFKSRRGNVLQKNAGGADEVAGGAGFSTSA